MQQRAVGLRQGQGHGRAIGGDRGDGHAACILVIDPALQVDAHSLGIQRGCVVKDHTIADRERIGQPVFGNLPSAGDPRMERAIEVLRDQAIIDILHRRLAVARAALVQIEAERLECRDAQNPAGTGRVLRLRTAGRHKRGRQKQSRSSAKTHDIHLLLAAYSVQRRKYPTFICEAECPVDKGSLPSFVPHLEENDCFRVEIS